LRLLHEDEYPPSLASYKIPAYDVRDAEGVSMELSDNPIGSMHDEVDIESMPLSPAPDLEVGSGIGIGRWM